MVTDDKEKEDVITLEDMVNEKGEVVGGRLYTNGESPVILNKEEYAVALRQLEATGDESDNEVIPPVESIGESDDESTRPRETTNSPVQGTPIELIDFGHLRTRIRRLGHQESDDNCKYCRPQYYKTEECNKHVPIPL